MEKEKKKKNKGLIALLIVVIGAFVIGAFITIGIPVLLMFGIILDGANAKETVSTDITQYNIEMGIELPEHYTKPWGMIETIFPREIKESYDVKSYKNVYYNPWDANYLKYLEVDFDEEDYQEEVTRLKDLGIKKYKGYYGVTGFENYELLAMNAHEYHGFIYAITDKKERKIVYVEMIFCNYFMDIDYNKYIPKEYLPDGFDATTNNSYRKSKLENK